jgi:Leucine-rich repeat (LRR) protein
MSNYEEIVENLTQLIEHYPDIPNSLFHDDEDWGITSGMYLYPKAFALKWGDDWNLKVRKMTITAGKTKKLDWISEMFPNLVHLNFAGSSTIKSLLGLEKLTNLKVLCLEKLSNWKDLNELKNIKNLRRLRIEVNSKDLKIDLNELPEEISDLYIGQNKIEDLLFAENLDFTRFKNLTILTIVATQLGDGGAFKLPSSLKEFYIYKNNSFANLSMFSTLSEDCKIVIRSLHLSTMAMPKEFKNINIIPHN